MYQSIQSYNTELESNDAKDGLGYCVRVSRIALLLLNVLCTLGSVVGLFFAIVEKEKLKDSLATVCANCTTIYFVVVGLFGALAFFSLLGFIALLTRDVCLRVVYGIYLVVVLCLSLALGIFYTLVVTDAISLRPSWEAMIAFDADHAKEPSPSGGMTEAVLAGRPPWRGEARGSEDDASGSGYTSALCRLETEFQCSGWGQLCNATEPYTAANTVETSCPICTDDDQQVIAAYGATCEATLRAKINGHKAAVLPICYAMAAIALLSLVINCQVERQVSREEYYAGRYYRV